jgi:hypothetical protein
MNKYAEIDAAIVRAISCGATKFSALQRACSLDIASLDRAIPNERLLDARLQAARKTGRIKYANGNWSIA